MTKAPAETIPLNADLPRDLSREVRAAAALEGMKLRDFLIEALVARVAKSPLRSEQSKR